MNATASTLTYVEAQRIVREALKDKTYQLYPMGQEAAAYLRSKRKRLTEGSFRKYEGALDKLARYFPDLELKDFEPPVGTERIEEFMDSEWGRKEPRTYNSNLSVVKDFFKFQVGRQTMHGDPAATIERAKARDPHRETFTTDQLRGIIASQEDLRDRLVLRLMLNYALRKGSVRQVRFKHFDHVRKTITVFAKGGTIRTLPLPDPAFWHDLERLILDTRAEPGHFLMPGRWSNGRATGMPSTRRHGRSQVGLAYVEGAKAHMAEPVTICGLSVGCNVRRHRLFESNFPIMVPPCGDHSGGWLLVFGHSVLERGRVVGKAKGGGNTIKRIPATTARGREAMGIDWMTRDELSESVPPAYTELIGHQLLSVVNASRAAA